MSDAYVRVALDHPLPTLFDYRCDPSSPPASGTLVAVPFGKRATVGLVIEVSAHSDVPADRLRSVQAVCDGCAPLSAEWLALVTFAAEYYQRPLGEVALPALPQALRDAARWPRLFAVEPRFRLTDAGRAALPDALPVRAAALRRLAAALESEGVLGASAARALHPKAIATLAAWQAEGWVEAENDTNTNTGAGAAGRALDCAAHLSAGTSAETLEAAISTSGVQGLDDSEGAGAGDPAIARRILTDEQTQAVEAIAESKGFAPFLLHGVTGSGKTEVYLSALEALLD
ncbi:MAG: hypothetical protein ACTHNR_13705, partial [Trinickia sp.]